jgi:hypothetical protein
MTVWSWKRVWRRGACHGEYHCHALYYDPYGYPF